MRPGHRARASRGRLSPLTTITLAVLAVALSAVAGGFAYFLPAPAAALQETGVPAVVPSPSPPATLFSPPPPASPSPASQPGAVPVLLPGSDRHSKFSPDP